MSISLNGFAIRIISTTRVYSFKKNGYNYLALPNFSNYFIKLTNDNSVRCDAKVFIDGDPIGIWRIEPYASIIIKRPASINRKFVFVNEKLYDPIQKKIIHNNPKNGLITVIFTPEKKMACPYQSPPYISVPTFYDEDMYSWSDVTPLYDTYTGSAGSPLLYSKPFLDNSSYISGATILGSGTDQQFNVTPGLLNIDKNNITTINVRLVAILTKPYTTIKKALKQYSITPSNSQLVYEVNDRMANNDKIMIERPYKMN